MKHNTLDLLQAAVLLLMLLPVAIVATGATLICLVVFLTFVNTGEAEGLLWGFGFLVSLIVTAGTYSACSDASKVLHHILFDKDCEEIKTPTHASRTDTIEKAHAA